MLISTGGSCADEARLVASKTHPSSSSSSFADICAKASFFSLTRTRASMRFGLFCRLALTLRRKVCCPSVSVYESLAEIIVLGRSQRVCSRCEHRCSHANHISVLTFATDRCVMQEAQCSVCARVCMIERDAGSEVNSSQSAPVNRRCLT